MKPSSFDYVKPETREEVFSHLAADPEETKIIAGGQSLVPMMNFRLARPSRLIDINAVPGLSGITTVDGRLHIGARTRHITLQNHGGSDPLAKILRVAAAHVGHLPIRTRGTFGGSLAHSTVESQRGGRAIGARDFFQSLYTTSMEPDELLVDVSLPALGPDHQSGFAEFARRAGDFAIIAVGTDIAVAHGRVKAARVCVGGVSDRPFRSAAVEQLLLGERWDAEPASSALVQEAAELLAEEVDPPSDAHGDADYRRDLVRDVFRKALAQGAQE
jgi:carbon-monoxide dehydrogenase medium subunit